MTCSPRILFILVATLLSSHNLFAQGSPLVGTWQGALNVRGMKLRMVFHITGQEGALQATLDSPDQGAKGIPTDGATVSGDTVTIALSMIGGKYVGIREAGDSTMTGTWTQGGTVFPIRLVKSDVIAKVNRPQEPKPPFPYTSEDVAIENPIARITIGGTLTMPLNNKEERGERRKDNSRGFPAVVLITGSGAQDRDETIFGHKPFWVIADHLTRNGIAVLRCDDRGVGKTTGSMRSATSADFATDVEAMVAYLKKRPEIRKEKIGLIGHSEGGLIAPMVAARSKDIAFIVMLAGPSMPGTDIIIQQDSLISLASGASISDVTESARRNRALFAVLKREPDSATAVTKIADTLVAMAKAGGGTAPDSLVRSESIKIATRMTSDWMRFFLFTDPMPALTKVRCPILALNGEKDLQVPPVSNLAGIAAAGTKGKNRDVTTTLMPGLNHLFQTAKSGSPAEYGQIEETISMDVLEMMTAWVTNRSR